jgi:hypothetical protein
VKYTFFAPEIQVLCFEISKVDFTLSFSLPVQFQQADVQGNGKNSGDAQQPDILKHVYIEIGADHHLYKGENCSHHNTGSAQKY